MSRRQRQNGSSRGDIAGFVSAIKIEPRDAALARMAKRLPSSVVEDIISKPLATEAIETEDIVHHTTAVAAEGLRSDVREKEEHADEETVNTVVEDIIPKPLATVGSKHPSRN